MEFEKVKKNHFPTDRPIPGKPGRVRGNKNIFKVGLSSSNKYQQSMFSNKNMKIMYTL